MKFPLTLNSVLLRILPAAALIAAGLTTSLNADLAPEGYRERWVNGITQFGIGPAKHARSEFSKALDGETKTTYITAKVPGPVFVGYDLGKPAKPLILRYKPRKGFESHLVGGQFQGSNESPYTGYVTLHEVGVKPSKKWQTVSLNVEGSYRYFRYLAPHGRRGHLNEFIFDVEYSEPESELAPVLPPSLGLTPGPELTPDPEAAALSLSAKSIGQQGVSFVFDLAKAERVSAAVYDQNDRQVRTLLYGEEFSSGLHKLLWDGLDRNGQAVAAGDYTLKLLRSNGLKAEYITSLGINPDSNPYDTWVGNHDGAASVAVDSTGMYIAAQKTETAPVLLKQSLDGTVRHWTVTRNDVTEGRFQGGISLATDKAGRVFMLQQNGWLQVIRASDGDLRDSWDVLPANVSRSSATYELLYEHSETRVAEADLAFGASTLVVSFRDENLIRWVDPESGVILADISVAEPRGLAVSNKGEVYVVSGSHILRVESNGSTQVIVSAELAAPQRICIDIDNTLLVTDGVTNTQVKRFSLSGELLATYGHSEGRGMGAYIASDYYAVRDITSDGQGGYLISEPECPPRRIAHFQGDGTVLNEWYGGQPYYAWAEPDPRDSSKVWVFSGDGLIFAEVDFDQHDWRVLETWDVGALTNGLMKHDDGHVARWRVLYSGEQCFLVSEEEPQVLRREPGKLIPYSVSSNDSDELARAIEIAGWTSSAKSFRWLDTNGDGIPQPAEFTFSGSSSEPKGEHVASDFSLLDYDRSSTSFAVVRTEPKWTQFGPYYPVGGEAGMDTTVAETATISRAGTRGSGVYRDAEGAYYGHFNIDNEAHGMAWPTYWAGISRFVKWSESGDELWSVGRHAYHGGLAGTTNSRAYLKTPNGQMHVPSRVIGETENAVVLADRVESMGTVWTKDGLYVGALLEDRIEDGLPDSVYSWNVTATGADAITTTDNATGGSLCQYPDGRVVWLTQGRNSVPMYAITGWGEWARSELGFTLESSAVQAKAAGNGLLAHYFNGANFDAAAGSRTETQVWHGLNVNAAEWDEVIDGFNGAIYDWTNGAEYVDSSKPFSVRWMGELEAPTTESFTFSVYARGGARLWLNGRQILFHWNEMSARLESEPIDLFAAERYHIQLDYYTTSADAAVSLNWESMSIDRQRIPTKYLYATSGVAVETASRTTRDTLLASSFEVASSGILDSDVDVYSVQGLRQRSFGQSGAFLGYERVLFSGKETQLVVHGTGEESGDHLDFDVTLEVRLGSPNGSLLAEVIMPKTIDTVSVPLSTVLSGEHDLYIVNRTTDEWHYIELRWIRFE